MFIDFKMSEVIISVLIFTFGFLANKIRDDIAECLKDDDVTYTKCRRLIIREFQDMRSKLDGLARSDLLNSICSLQDGVNTLFHSSDSSENTTELLDQATLLEIASFADPGSMHIVLINAMASLKIRSNDRYKSAIESFKSAREKATKAFCNEALPIEDRIQASQVRMMARILENLDDPEGSAIACLLYLKQLHDIRDIQKIFSTLINGGMKSRFNNTKRLSIAASVQVINQILFEFIEKYTKSSLLGRLRSRMLDWPTITLGKETFHPLCREFCLNGRGSGDSGVQIISTSSYFAFGDSWGYRCIGNSKGDIVAMVPIQWNEFFECLEESDESHIPCKFLTEEYCASECYYKAMNIDAKDNLYVMVKHQSTLLKALGTICQGMKLMVSLYPPETTF